MRVFFEAVLIGLAIAIPIDEIYLLCVKKTLDRGMKAAFLIGLGAALADCSFALLAMCNIPCVSCFFNEHGHFIKSAAGVFLIFIGLREFRKESAYALDIPHSTEASLAFKAYFLELSNPVTIAVILGLYRSIHSNSFSETAQILMGIFMSVIVWWLFLGFMISRYKHFLSEKVLHMVKFLTSLGLVVIGIMIIWSK